jgi:hypothetical protein
MNVVVGSLAFDLSHFSAHRRRFFLKNAAFFGRMRLFGDLSFVAPPHSLPGRACATLSTRMQRNPG